MFALLSRCVRVMVYDHDCTHIFWVHPDRIRGSAQADILVAGFPCVATGRRTSDGHRELNLIGGPIITGEAATALLEAGITIEQGHPSN